MEKLIVEFIKDYRRRSSYLLQQDLNAKAGLISGFRDDYIFVITRTSDKLITVVPAKLRLNFVLLQKHVKYLTSTIYSMRQAARSNTGTVVTREEIITAEEASDIRFQFTPMIDH